ncbi:hypothetical protein BG011_010075 [Mortierella polycephala]|uniref:F-box domain-containing protein n=1 Tax=Mortierella polycephala TaxID=41804 RepID=A0A9P6TW74_9FUNG|nr:hypothetical protein BG011_010075 [Mortierella polycephala]
MTVFTRVWAMMPRSLATAFPEESQATVNATANDTSTSTSTDTSDNASGPAAAIKPVAIIVSTLPTGIGAEVEAGSATARALAIPEILERIGSHLVLTDAERGVYSDSDYYPGDPKPIVNCMLVSRAFYRAFLPALWYSVRFNVPISGHDADGNRVKEPPLEAMKMNTDNVRVLMVQNRDYTFPASDPLDGERTTGHFLVNLDNVFRAFQSTDTAAGVKADMDVTADMNTDRNGGRRLQKLRLISFPHCLPKIYLYAHLSKFTHLRHLDISVLDNHDGRFKVQQILSICPRLESLRVVTHRPVPPQPLPTNQGVGNGDDDPGNDSDHDSTMSKAYPMSALPLKQLHLIGTQFLSEDFLQFAQQCPQLTDLQLIGQSIAQWDWTLATIDQFAQACPKIVQLHIDPGYGSCFMDTLPVRILEVFTGLVEFKVPRCDFGGPESWEALGSCIEQIQELNVAFTRKPGVSSQMLVELMAKAKNLRILDASGISLYPSQFNIDPLANDGSSRTAPMTLEGNRNITQGGISDMPSLISPSWACHGLEVISIGFSTLHMDPNQCQAIYAGLSRLRRLRRIHILPNHLPISFDAGLDQLASLKELTHFDVHGTERRMSEEVVKWMGRSWPKLQLLRLYLDDDEYIGFGSSKRAPPGGRSHIIAWLQQVGRKDVQVRVD